jgi:hypothetical protein
VTSNLPPSAVAIVVLAMLAGCGAPTETVPWPTTSASPGPEILVTPETRLPLTCEEAAPGDVRAGLLGEPLRLAGGSGEPFQGIGDVILQQAGFLDCVWGTPQGVNLRFTATPEGRELYETWVEFIVPSPYYEIDAHGDRSVTYCGYGQCFFYLLVGEHAIEGVATRHDLMDDSELRPLFTSVVDSLALRVKARLAEEREPWTPPGPQATWGACSANPTLAAIAEAVGRPGSVGVGLEHALSDAAIRVGAESCNLGATGYDDVYMGVTFVPSAAWAMPILIDQPPAPDYGTPFEVVIVDGRAPVLVAIDTTNGYANGLVEVRGGLASIWWSGAMSAAEFADLIVGVADAMEASA